MKGFVLMHLVIALAVAIAGLSVNGIAADSSTVRVGDDECSELKTAVDHGENGKVRYCAHWN